MKPEPNILLLGRSGTENLLMVLKGIRAAELQQVPSDTYLRSLDLFLSEVRFLQLYNITKSFL